MRDKSNDRQDGFGVPWRDETPARREPAGLHRRGPREDTRVPRPQWAEDGPRPFWRQRSWQLSAGFFAVVLFVAAVVALTRSGGSGSGDGTVSARGGQVVALPTMNGGRPEGCATDDGTGDGTGDGTEGGTGGGDTTPPTAVPTDVQWRDLSGSRVPVSASAGPTMTTGPVWWCFAHTPTGAALAAHVIPSQMSGSAWRTVARMQVVAGRGRDLFVTQRATVPDTPRGASGSSASYAGFSVVSYRKSAATVALLIKTASGYAATNVGLRWDDGDWKVAPAADGSLHTPVQTVSGTGGFLLWGV
ncbi:hypothetical protein AB0D74_26210 [Streptomyces sp. NPDC048278]|uniref:hypothetical protein n=1 Tax=Streptomyces sp. NPDC048278 TaxID=3155809 RepID=UPI00342B25BD